MKFNISVFLGSLTRIQKCRTCKYPGVYDSKDMGGGRGKLAIVGSVEFHCWPTVRWHTPCRSCLPCIRFPGQHFASAAHPHVEIVGRPSRKVRADKPEPTTHWIFILSNETCLWDRPNEKTLPWDPQQTLPMSSE